VKKISVPNSATKFDRYITGHNFRSKNKTYFVVKLNSFFRNQLNCQNQSRFIISNSSILVLVIDFLLTHLFSELAINFQSMLSQVLSSDLIIGFNLLVFTQLSQISKQILANYFTIWQLT